MQRLIIPALALVLASCGTGEQPLSAENMTIEVGRPFPNLILPSLDGGAPASIARFRGKKILLHVFASW